MNYQQDYIKYRLERARETLKIAKLTVQEQAFNSCVNRLYYAMFYKDFFYAKAEDVSPLIPKVEAFIELMTQQLLPPQNKEK